MRTDGALDRVDAERVRATSDQSRHAYYRKRLQHPIFRIEGDLTRQILVDIANARLPDKSRVRLRRLCEAAIERAELADEPEFRELPRTAFSTALIERGIVSGKNGRWEIAIPSMADWAANELGIDPPEWGGARGDDIGD